MLNEIAGLINEKVSGANATVTTAQNGDNGIIVDAASINAVCKVLKDNDKFPFNALQAVSGVDYTEYIEVNYFLTNFDVNNYHNLMLKVRLADRNNPSLDTVCDVWAAANFQERECYDMFGVTFNNHPDLRRILCPDDWKGFPLRKDYMAAKDYNGMEVFPDHKMNIEDREFIVRQKEIEEAAKAQAQD